MSTSTTDFYYLGIQIIDSSRQQLIWLVTMTKLTLISISPRINLSFISYHTTVIIPAADINNFVPDKMIKLNWLIFIFQASCSQLSINVATPNKNLSIVT